MMTRATLAAMGNLELRRKKRMWLEDPDRHFDRLPE
jgi:hypothetical protein